MKTLVIVTGFLSPHMLPLCEELAGYYNILGCIQTMEMTQERKNLGYQAENVKFPVLQLSDNAAECRRTVLAADVVIMACGAFGILKERLSQNKLTFILHERLFKKGIIKLLDPRIRSYIKISRSARKRNIYLLAIGQFSAIDFCRLGFPKNKIFLYGYFPRVEEYNRTVCSHRPIELLWVGRMVDVKRPMMAARLAARMGQDYHLTMIGEGKRLKIVERYIRRKKTNASLLGRLSNTEVLKKMSEADILLSTSDRGEGWGAVINEGMSCGCAIVCSDSIGCFGTLADTSNAGIFRTGSMRSLIGAVKKVSNNLEFYSKKSREKVAEEINPAEAARRLSILESALSSKNDGSIFEEGICSKAFKNGANQ